MTVDRKRLRELALAATPGPWTARQRTWGSPDYEGGPEVRLWELDGPRAQIAGATIHASGGDGEADIALMAAANPQTILALLDALEAQPDDARDAKRLRELREFLPDQMAKIEAAFDCNYV